LDAHDLDVMRVKWDARVKHVDQGVSRILGYQQVRRGLKSICGPHRWRSGPFSRPAASQEPLLVVPSPHAR
jgi:hypothetical protein